MLAEPGARVRSRCRAHLLYVHLLLCSFPRRQHSLGQRYAYHRASLLENATQELCNARAPCGEKLLIYCTIIIVHEVLFLQLGCPLQSGTQWLKSTRVLRSMMEAADKFWGTRLIQDAGHWVQQEQPQEVVKWLLQFLKEVMNDTDRARL